MKKVKFTLLGNIISGGIKTNNNFLITRDYISGNVLRAAFAWSILYECPYADEVYNDKRYFVVYRGEKCDGCKNAEKCKKFSDMKFSDLYLENTVPAPFTLRECKAYGTEHHIMDIIAENGRLECKDCKGRMETVKGYINPYTEKTVKVLKNTSVHTAIDEYTNTALDGSLFSIEAITKGQVFEGFIDDCDSGLINLDDVIFCGKYSSSGYGKMKITSITDVNKTECAEAVDNFNDKFGTGLKKEYGDKLFATILFLSDAKLGLEEFSDSTPSSSENYRQEWEKRIFGDNRKIRLEKIYAQNYIYSGYDTSRIDNNYERKKNACILTEKGTSVLISFDFADKNQVIAYLDRLCDNGIGKETEIGYGRIDVCNKLHLLGVK